MALFAISLVFAAAQGVVAQEPPSSPTSPTSSSVREVILVYKSHFDIGYTHLASETIHNYRTTTIDGALEVVDANQPFPPKQQFVWTVPGWPMKKILEDWPGQTAVRRQRILDAFRQGRFAVHALPFTMQTEMMEPEVLVRSLGYASALARSSGKPLPTGAKMTDVPEHSQILPTLLARAGVTFLHLGCNPASAVPEVPLLFWWEGPDSSRVLTMYHSEYGGGLLPPKGWKHKTWLALVMAGDNQPAPPPQAVHAQIQQLKQALPGATIRLGTLNDFADRMAGEDLAGIPVVRKDMPDTWIHGLMCDPDGVALARRAAPGLTAAELLKTQLAHWLAATPDQRMHIASGYEHVMLYYEHTWGGAMSWIGAYTGVKDGIGQVANWTYGEAWRKNLEAGKFNRSIASWEEHTDYARAAAKSADTALANGMESLAASVTATGSSTIIYNPLPWKRGALVGGKWTPNLPAGGYTTVATRETRPAPAPIASSIENETFKVTVDPAKGVISSLVEKATGRELVDRFAAHGFGQYLRETFSAAEVAAYTKAYTRGGHLWGTVELGKPNLPPASETPYRSAVPAGFSLSCQTQGDTRSIVLRSTPDASGVNHPVTTAISLTKGAPWLEIELIVEKPADPWPEAGWICLPFQIANPRFRVGRHGFVMDPATDIIAGAKKHLYAVGTGVALFDTAGKGVGLCGPDTPLVSLGEPGMWKFTRDYVPEKPVVYFNLYNNQWSTNYRLWNSGKWTYRFRVWAFDRYDTASSLVVPSLETRLPVHTATTPPSPHGRLPASQSGVSVSRKGVLVTAFGANPDGTGTLLRVWELAGVSGELTVSVPGMFASATPVNLRGETLGQSVAIKDGRLVFPLEAYAPASFVLN